jgi:hypothetical protein
MSSPNLQLNVSGQGSSITPLPAHIQSRCTAGNGCCGRASHRLLLGKATRVELFCDGHTVEWAHEHGLSITTARLNHSAA